MTRWGGTRDVVITGLGAVTCHGYGVGALARAMSSATAYPPKVMRDPYAHAGAPLIQAVPDAVGARAAVQPVWPGAAPPAHAERFAGRAEEFAVAAAREAAGDAGLAGEDLADAAVVVGSCLGDAAAWEPGPGGTPSGERIFRIAAGVADRLGAHGYNSTIANACAAGAYAIAIGADLIRLGEADVVVAGGADAYSRVGWACFDRLGAIDPLRCRPFDRDRRGTILSEGAGMVVLESGERARARGARVRAGLSAATWSCDAYHTTAPEPDGGQITRAVRGALAEAGLDGGDLGCVIPHGTGTRLNDVVESQALAQVLGRRVEQVPLYSLKALIGHTGGAAGALATVAATLMLDSGVVPMNVPLDTQDPQCPVYLPQGRPVTLPRSRVMVNAYAFGGNNAALVLAGAA